MLWWEERIAPSGRSKPRTPALTLPRTNWQPTWPPGPQEGQWVQPLPVFLRFWGPKEMMMKVVNYNLHIELCSWMKTLKKILLLSFLFHELVFAVIPGIQDLWRKHFLTIRFNGCRQSKQMVFCQIWTSWAIIAFLSNVSPTSVSSVLLRTSFLLFGQIIDPALGPSECGSDFRN